MESGWPAGHAIGVYLCVDAEMTLVATARGREDVSRLFRHLADAWDLMQHGPPVLPADNSWLYDAHVEPSLSA